MLGVLLYTAVLGAAALFVGPWLWTNVVLVARRLWATRNIPEPPGYFLVGHIPVLLQSRSRSFRLFHKWSEQWPIFRIRFFGRPVVIVTDPDVYQPLMRPGPNKLKKYCAPYRMFEVFTKPERANILTSPENATWKAVRQAAVASLNMTNLRLCFPQITAVTQRLIATLSAAGPSTVFDMDAVAAAITVDVIGVAGFNRDLQATCRLPAGAIAAGAAGAGTAQAAAESAATQQQDKSKAGPAGPAAAGICGSVSFPRGGEVLDVIGHLTVAMQGRNHPFNRWFPWRQAYRDLFYWGGRMSELVHNLTSSMEATPPPPHTLGAHLLGAKYSSGVPLDRAQIMADIGIMWGAGFETTAHTICWALSLLSTHPEAEARLCAELDSLGLLVTPERPTPAPLQWEHLGQLKYLSAVLNESMRLYPTVASGTIRITDKPISLAGHALPAGQPVLIPFWAIHRSTRLWGPDANSFRPERFLAAGVSGARAAGAASGAGDGLATASVAVPAAPAGASASVKSSRAEAGSVTGPVQGVSEDEDYVDVAADLAAERDQAPDKSPQPLCSTNSTTAKLSPISSSSSTRPAPALDLKDPTVDRRGFHPFSIGSRNCVGQALAMVELKAVLAMLLGTYSFTLHPSMGGHAGVDASAKQAVTLKPEHGLLMTLTPRRAPAAAAAPTSPPAGRD